LYFSTCWQLFKKTNNLSKKLPFEILIPIVSKKKCESNRIEDWCMKKRPSIEKRAFTIPQSKSNLFDFLSVKNPY
jgi:hypothetical protein